ncbi:hypothetical protein LB565_08340 [Mesorhizobium sp. CA14]|uniref:hypothetical protein n=1 Tax=Mesorhizobium sp. CA14 TaxID=2876642 RepID=UPI001CCED5BB|nr:hypothetical protein [Mesorhizobium sp. CA14]MBZ9847992.1 hypothetical protein [Mesorhizobium sp. CA14]
MSSIKPCDTVAITETIRKRVTEDRGRVLIPSYHQPHSIVDTSRNISSGQQIELTGEVLRMDDDTVTVGGKDLGITIKRGAVRLVTSHVAPNGKK